MPDPPKRPRPPSRPDAGRPSIELDATVGAAKSYAASQDHVRPELARKQTFSGLGAMKPPPLPGELTPTLKAPARPSLKETWNVPAPPLSVALARRTPVPPSGDSPARADATTGPPGASLPPMSLTPEAAALAALRRRAEDAESRRDELERRERVRAEAQSAGGWPPKVQRSVSPVPSSAPSKADAALGMTVRTLLAKAAPFLLAAAGIGGGVTAVAKPTADPAKTDAVLASQEAMRADVALLREQVAGMLKREAARDQYVRCLEESVDEVGEQLLPAQDRLTNASPLRAYVKRCQRLRP